MYPNDFRRWLGIIGLAALTLLVGILGFVGVVLAKDWYDSRPKQTPPPAATQVAASPQPSASAQPVGPGGTNGQALPVATGPRVINAQHGLSIDARGRHFMTGNPANPFRIAWTVGSGEGGNFLYWGVNGRLFRNGKLVASGANGVPVTLNEGDQMVYEGGGGNGGFALEVP